MNEHLYGLAQGKITVERTPCRIAPKLVPRRPHGTLPVLISPHRTHADGLKISQISTKKLTSTMTTSRKPSTLNLEELQARAQLHGTLAQTPDVPLEAKTAAFFLGIHPKTMERWRTEKRPPHPMAMNAEGRSGIQVRYRVGELLDFIRQSQKQAETTGASPFVSHTVVNGKRQKPPLMAWATEESVEVETLDEPFFMTADGLVLSHCWDEDVPTIAERVMSGKSSIRWMSWDKALAAVWQDDRLRLGWLGHADVVAPSLRAVVEANRQAALSKI